MLTMIWRHEDKHMPYLEFPIKIDRDQNIKVKDMDLDSATIWHIRKTLNKWGPISQLTMWEELTINNIADYLEKGIKYKEDEFYISYKKTLEAAHRTGLIPEITIGTFLIDDRFKRIPVEYVEDLPRLISVWEKYDRHPELVEIAKEIINSTFI